MREENTNSTTTWTRERRRLDADAGDLHPFRSAAAWSATFGLAMLTGYLARAGAWHPEALSALALACAGFVIAYPVLIYANWTGAFYEREREEPAADSPAPVTDVRAFVPSQNAPATIRVGAWRLPRAAWAALFAAAEANGGRLTRDVAVEHLPRELYRNWAGTKSELMRLNIIDESGRVTERGWQFYRMDVAPSPTGENTAAGALSTHARRTHGAHGPDLIAVGEAD